jgi:hypothetical protein
MKLKILKGNVLNKKLIIENISKGTHYDGLIPVILRRLALSRRTYPSFYNSEKPLVSKVD